MDDDLTDALNECLRVLDENIDILSDIEVGLEEEKEDQIQTDMELHNLYDMAEDILESAKLKTAERKFLRRQAEN